MKEYEKLMRKIGIEKKKGYIQLDYDVILQKISERYEKMGIIVSSSDEMKDKFKEYFWRLAKRDKYVEIVRERGKHGYFIYVPKGVKVEEPIYACLLLSKDIVQPVHNVVIVEENAELNLVTGCAAPRRKALHIGVSEFFVKKNAKLNFVMIHGWEETVDVRPRTFVLVEEGGEFNSYYVNLNPLKTIQMMPEVTLKKNAKSYITSIIFGKKRSFFDVGAKVILEGKNSKAEIVSRCIASENSEIIMRGKIVGKEKSRGHIECKGLILSESAKVTAIPEIVSFSKEAILTHEAAIGKISEEEIIYLMMKGFKEEEAVSLIVRGFVDVGIEKLPESLRKGVWVVLEKASSL